jgi:hypothetical protein
MAKRVLHQGIVGAGIAVLVAISLVRLSASQVTNAGVAIDGDDIGGVVTSTAGPEAGVWVIAETTDLPTKFVRIVVTDDRGRYVLPDMPNANYNVWVRGYGLVDSRRVQAAPGKTVNLTAVVAPNAREAAQYYPANYWWSMLQVPATHEFPGTGAKGNGINENVKSQSQWLMRMRTEGCLGCHLMGTKATREIPPALGTFANTAAAWDRRVQSGQNGAGMVTQLNNLGRARMVAMFADWSDRIKAGEVPQAPPRPQGRERNVVITMWDWADPKAYLHDPVSSDKRNPRVNANGPVYGSLEAANDYLPVIDPQRNTVSRLPLQVRDPKSPPVSAFMPQPSPYWGEEPIWTSRTSAHSFAMDGQGRVWTAQKIRPNETPEFCRTGSNHPSAKLFPINESGR